MVTRKAPGLWVVVLLVVGLASCGRGSPSADRCEIGERYVPLAQQTFDLFVAIDATDDPVAAQELQMELDVAASRGNAVLNELWADPPPELEAAAEDVATGEVPLLVAAVRDAEAWFVTVCGFPEVDRSEGGAPSQG